MPEAGKFVLHIMAAVAEQEAEAISARTKAALAAAKARGTALGWAQPQRDPAARMAAVQKGVVANKGRADQFAEKLRPVVEAMGSDVSLRDVARELNSRGIPTARGKQWQAASVKNLLARLDAA
jgi:DNA invertase Pin-like site-specific DNA recombinase